MKASIRLPSVVRSRARSPLAASVLALFLSACGGSEPSSTKKDDGFALFGTWKFLELTQGAASVAAKVTFAEAKAVLAVTCSETGGESATVQVESKAEYTATTYKILENKEETKVVNGADCYASWKIRTVSWTRTGDTLKVKGDDGVENTLTRVP